MKMKIDWKKEIYLVSISVDADSDLKERFGLNNRKFCRINGVWHGDTQSTKGNPLNWIKVNGGLENQLEREFISIDRDSKIKNILK